MNKEYDYERDEYDRHEGRRSSFTASYEEKLDRWREEWRREIDDDLDAGR